VLERVQLSGRAILARISAHAARTPSTEAGPGRRTEDVVKTDLRGRGIDAAAHGRDAPGFIPGRFTPFIFTWTTRSVLGMRNESGLYFYALSCEL